MGLVANFLQGTVKEGLQKLAQPIGLVPAAILALLNLAFVYPTARDEHVAVADQFKSLDSAWQVTVVVVIVLILGCLLTNLAGLALDTLGGNTWKGSVLHELLSRWERGARDRAVERAGEAEDDLELEFALDAADRFPLHNRVAPTRLGNAIRAAEERIYERYGFQLVALWSQLESAPAVKDSPALAATKDQKAALDLLANIVVVAIVFLVEAVAFFGLRSRWREVSIALLALLPAAYLTYRVAIEKARSWGDALTTAVDLHKKDLQKALGMRAATGFADEQVLWQNASFFYLGAADQAAAVFDPPSQTAALMASAGIQATVVASVAAGVTPVAGSWHVDTIHYLLIVARDESQLAAANATIVLSDSQIAAFSSAGNGTPVTNNSRLLWDIDDLEPGGARHIEVSLPSWTIVAPTQLVDDRPWGILIPAVTTAASVNVTTALATSEPPKLTVAGERRAPTGSAVRTWTWSLDPSDGAA